METIIAGRFETLAAAQQAEAMLIGLEFAEDDICSFALNPPGQHATYPIGGDEYADDNSRNAGTGAARGGAIGGAIGLGTGLAAAASACRRAGCREGRRKNRRIVGTESIPGNRRKRHRDCNRHLAGRNMGGFQSTVTADSAPVTHFPSHPLQRHAMDHLPQQSSRLQQRPVRKQSGKIGYILLWLLGIPLPVLFVIYLLRGCS